MTLQERIDAIDYPPTMTYMVDSCRPTGFLRERMEVIDSVAPGFFSGAGKKFLDVGCSKGFFSLLAHLGRMEVTGIDPNQSAVKLCMDIMPDHRFYQCSFAEFWRTGFDRAFIGNGPHYLFRELGGSFDWIRHLFLSVKESVLLEGPVGMDCLDMYNCIFEEQRPAFNPTAFYAATDNYFELIEEAGSPSPGRLVSLWKRRANALPHSKQYPNHLKILYSILLPFVKKTDTIVELCTRHDRGVISKELLPHESFIRADANPDRGDVAVEVPGDALPPCDVAISTAILHHSRAQDYKSVLHAMAQNTRRVVAVSGPVGGEPWGDHRSTLDQVFITDCMEKAGFRVAYAGRPDHMEIMLVYERERL